MGCPNVTNRDKNRRTDGTFTNFHSPKTGTVLSVREILLI